MNSTYIKMSNYLLEIPINTEILVAFFNRILDFFQPFYLVIKEQTVIRHNQIGLVEFRYNGLKCGHHIFNKARWIEQSILQIEHNTSIVDQATFNLFHQNS